MSETTDNSDLSREQINQRLEAILQEGFRRESWSIENSVCFYAQTTTWMFAQWMIANTKSRRVDTETGFYSLSNAFARPHPWPDHVGPITVEVIGSHDRENLEESVHYAGLHVPQIIFYAQPISSERVEVKAICKTPELQGYFQELLTVIGQAFDVPGLLPQPKVQDTPPSTPAPEVPAPLEPTRTMHRTNPGKGGRISLNEDEWARTEVWVNERGKNSVKEEWKQRLKSDNPARYKELADLDDTFRNMIKKPPAELRRKKRMEL
jgi:hypothetical protein